MISIQELNKLEFEDFIKLMGNIIEHCPVLTAALWRCRPFSSIEHLILKMSNIVDELPHLVQEGILRVHPDLAGALAEAGQLTSESTKEQSHANLNLMTPEEKSKMAHLNKKYKEKFGFPFVICARLNKKDAILQGLEQRYFNDLEQELKIGIDNVMKICELRVRDLVQVAQQKEPSRL